MSPYREIFLDFLIIRLGSISLSKSKVNQIVAQHFQVYMFKILIYITIKEMEFKILNRLLAKQMNWKRTKIHENIVMNYISLNIVSILLNAMLLFQFYPSHNPFQIIVFFLFFFWISGYISTQPSHKEGRYKS